MVAKIRPAEALVVVDVQVAFVSGSGAVPAAEPLTEVLAGLVTRARAAGAVVIHLRNDGPAGAVDEPGTPGWELYLPVLEGADEVVVRKIGDDGFDGTDLGGLLRRRGVRRLVIGGVMSEMCVSATARSALRLGFGVVLPHDAHATFDIPAAADISDVVPAAVASRAAEWALGDGIDIVARAAVVDFVAPRHPHRHDGNGSAMAAWAGD